MKLNTQSEPLNAYARALHRFTEIFVIRILSPWLWPDWLFFNTPLGREMSKQIDTLHKFTRGVIRNRKADVLAELQTLYQKVDTVRDNRNATGDSDNNNDATFENNEPPFEPKKQKRLAFLDLLIKLHLEGVLSEEEVREEVDMFTFAGHDTTG